MIDLTPTQVCPICEGAGHIREAGGTLKKCQCFHARQQRAYLGKYYDKIKMTNPSALNMAQADRILRIEVEMRGGKATQFDVNFRDALIREYCSAVPKGRPLTTWRETTLNEMVSTQFGQDVAAKRDLFLLPKVLIVVVASWPEKFAHAYSVAEQVAADRAINGKGTWFVAPLDSFDALGPNDVVAQAFKTMIKAAKAEGRCHSFIYRGKKPKANPTETSWAEAAKDTVLANVKTPGISGVDQTLITKINKPVDARIQQTLAETKNAKHDSDGSDSQPPSE